MNILIQSGNFSNCIISFYWLISKIPQFEFQAILERFEIFLLCFCLLHTWNSRWDQMQWKLVMLVEHVEIWQAGSMWNKVRSELQQSKLMLCSNLQKRKLCQRGHCGKNKNILTRKYVKYVLIVYYRLHCM